MEHKNAPAPETPSKTLTLRKETVRSVRTNMKAGWSPRDLSRVCSLILRC